MLELVQRRTARAVALAVLSIHDCFAEGSSYRRMERRTARAAELAEVTESDRNKYEIGVGCKNGRSAQVAVERDKILCLNGK